MSNMHRMLVNQSCTPVEKKKRKTGPAPLVAIVPKSLGAGSAPGSILHSWRLVKGLWVACLSSSEPGSQKSEPIIRTGCWFEATVSPGGHTFGGSKCSGICEEKLSKTSLDLKPSKSLEIPAGPENIGPNVFKRRNLEWMVSWCSKIQWFKVLLCWSQICPPRNGTWLMNTACTWPLFPNISGTFCWHIALALALGPGQVGRWAHSNCQLGASYVPGKGHRTGVPYLAPRHHMAHPMPGSTMDVLGNIRLVLCNFPTGFRDGTWKTYVGNCAGPENGRKNVTWC